MPRIPTSLLRKAFAINPLLSNLLPPCRDLRAAQNELRWLREHVDKVARARSARGDRVSKSAFLRDLVRQRASGKPLQYLLGTEYFGDVEIHCRPGVLIPRQDTATSIQHLARLLGNVQSLPSELRVLDLCTGTGCIPLLFHHELHAIRNDVDLRAVGIDISEKALHLAAHNLNQVRKEKSWVAKGAIGYMKADVLANPFTEVRSGRMHVSTALRYAGLPHLWDIVISNPPYISPKAYWKTTTRSVRIFEPKLALVPPSQSSDDSMEKGDTFYMPILRLAGDVEAKIVLLEIADLDQAIRIAHAAREMNAFDGIQIWRDHPDELQTDSPLVEGFSVLGQGNARSVVCWRGAGATWLAKSSQPRAAGSSGFPCAPLVADNDGLWADNPAQMETRKNSDVVPRQSSHSPSLFSVRYNFLEERSPGRRGRHYQELLTQAQDHYSVINERILLRQKENEAYFQRVAINISKRQEMARFKELFAKATACLRLAPTSMMPLRIPLTCRRKPLHLNKVFLDTAFYLYNQGWTVESLTVLFSCDDEKIIQRAIQDRIRARSLRLEKGPKLGLNSRPEKENCFLRVDHLVLQHFLDGHTLKAIGKLLGISPYKVSTSMARLRKYGDLPDREIGR